MIWAILGIGALGLLLLGMSWLSSLRERRSDDYATPFLFFGGAMLLALDASLLIAYFFFVTAMAHAV